MASIVKKILLITALFVFSFSLSGCGGVSKATTQAITKTNYHLQCGDSKLEFIQRNDIRYQRSAKIDNTEYGLVLEGGHWTNGQNKGKGYDGNGIVSTGLCDITDSELRIKFLALGSGKYAAYNLYPKGFKHNYTYTSHHVWATTKKIPDGVDLYQTLKVEASGNWTLNLSTTNYVGLSGSKTIYEKKGAMAKEELDALSQTSIVISFGDNYAGNDAVMFIREVVVEKNSAKIARMQPELEKAKRREKLQKEVKKTVKLLDSGFETRGLRFLDKFVADNKGSYAVIYLDTKKYKYAYHAYLYSKQFEKMIKAPGEESYLSLSPYTDFAQVATWFGYENLIPEMQKRFKSAVKVKKTYFDSDVIESHIAIVESSYLLSIGKDEEAYDILFAHQPFTKFAKMFITSLAMCKSSFTKNIDKLAVATDIPIEEFDPKNCQKQKPYPFFFDIDGRKVFKNEELKTSKPKKKVQKTMKNDAIELLD